MASLPYEIDATLPASANQVSQYPGVSQTFRDIVKTWLEGISDKTTGLIKRAGITAVERLPYGMIVDFGGTSAPSGWLLCYGQAVSRTTYASLFTAIGTSWGTGDGSTTFNLPDLRGRVTAGEDDMGGSSANRLTGLSGGVNGDTFAAAGGTESHTLVVAEMPAHAHPGSSGITVSHAHTEQIPNNAIPVDIGSSFNVWQALLTTSSTGSATPSVTVTVTSQGSDGAHNNVQPTAIVNKIIFAGV